MPDLKALGDAVILAVKAHVAEAVGVLRGRLDELEGKLLAIPAGPPGGKGDKGDKGDTGDTGGQGERGQEGATGGRGDRGDTGPAGKDADPLLVRAMVDEEVGRAVAAMPKPAEGINGINGKDAPPVDIAGIIAEVAARIPAPKDGKDGASVHPDSVLLMVREAVDKAVAGISPASGTDGRDGRDGKDGDPGRDALEVEPLLAIDESKGYPRGTWATHRGGLIRAVRATDPVAPELGGIERAGWAIVMNGVHLESEEALDEGRTIRRSTEYTSGRVFARELKTSAIVYRGVWREGTFERGDTATWGGSVWHCEGTTTDKPGTSAAWKLMVKSGRDGKSFDAPPKNEPAATVRMK